jgi:hypothetical protein
VALNLLILTPSDAEMQSTTQVTESGGEPLGQGPQHLLALAMRHVVTLRPPNAK